MTLYENSWVLLPLPHKDVVKGIIPSPFEGEGYDSMDGIGRAEQEPEPRMRVIRIKALAFDTLTPTLSLTRERG